VAGVRLNYVPFDGGTGVLQAFLGRNVTLIVLALDEAVPLLKGDRARALALSATRRSRQT
jgi:tripartite-type tricarboxylate transporter receptor subunit TctC